MTSLGRLHKGIVAPDLLKMGCCDGLKRLMLVQLKHVFHLEGKRRDWSGEQQRYPLLRETT